LSKAKSAAQLHIFFNSSVFDIELQIMFKLPFRKGSLFFYIQSRGHFIMFLR
jgi:hypothetical protein